MPNHTLPNLQEAHHYFAILANKQTWELVEKENRTSNDDEQLIRTAQTSLYHWLAIGNDANFQRGYWLLAHCYALLGNITEANTHAQICYAYTKNKAQELQVFDNAYCFEALSRVANLNGNLDEAHAYRQLALDIADEIANFEDLSIFLNDLYRGYPATQND